MWWDILLKLILLRVEEGQRNSPCLWIGYHLMSLSTRSTRCEFFLSSEQTKRLVRTNKWPQRNMPDESLHLWQNSPQVAMATRVPDPGVSWLWLPLFFMPGPSYDPHYRRWQTQQREPWLMEPRVCLPHPALLTKIAGSLPFSSSSPHSHLFSWFFKNLYLYPIPIDFIIKMVTRLRCWGIHIPFKQLG